MMEGGAPFALERLAGRGIPTFRCGANKRPLTGGGLYDASAKPDMARSCSRTFPQALAAVPTGPTCGLFVVDLDVDRETGETVGEDTIRALGIDPASHPYAVRTRSGGWHLLYRWQDGLPTSAGRIGPGVDTRGV